MNEFYHSNIIGMGLTLFIVMNKPMLCSFNFAAKIMQVLEYANIYLVFFHIFLMDCQKRGISITCRRLSYMVSQYLL